MEESGGLTLAPLAAVGVQVVGVEPLRFVQPIQYFPDVHDLMIKDNTNETVETLFIEANVSKSLSLHTF